MYENNDHPPISRTSFAWRLVFHGAAAMAVLLASLLAGLYALYAGLVFLITAGVMVAPVLHRILHRFHWDENE